MRKECKGMYCKVLSSGRNNVDDNCKIGGMDGNTDNDNDT